MYKKDLALNNQQYLICHKTKLNQILDGAVCVSFCVYSLAKNNNPAFILPSLGSFVNVMGPLPTHSWTLPNSILIESQVLSKILDTLLIFD